MPIEDVDVTGTPRPDRDIEAAHQAVTLWIVKEPTAKGPDGMPRVFHLIVIRDALAELLALRKKIDSRKA